MPTISLNRSELFRRLEREYTDAEFEQLCFDYGIELDKVTTEEKEKAKERGVANAVDGGEVIYKIDVPANRYDLLCMEGISTALRVFLGLQEPPVYRATSPVLTLTAASEVSGVRAFVVCAVLRDIAFNEQRYQSFIDLQEKLHQNLCRRRTLVSIGTHDLDSIEAPFSYEAKPPSEIRFVPLDKTEEVDGHGVMTLYEHSHLREYLDIIRSEPLYPVIYDAKRRVLSLPPIINGDHSKISLNTKNVFIEITATDLTKANMVLNIMCAMFSGYCATPYTVEGVNVVTDGRVSVTPNLATYSMGASVSYINTTLALNLSAENIVSYLKKMMIHPVTCSADGKSLEASIPVTRADILHQCDIMEDVAIGYGYNNLEIVPPKTACVGAQQPLNYLTEQLRHEMAQIGFYEVLSLSLCSWDDCFKNLRRPNDGKTAVVIDKAEGGFQIGRTSLLPGLFKTIFHNKSLALPIRLFEISDVMLRSDESDVGAINRRYLSAIYYGATPGLEIIHGVVDFLMQMLDVKESEYSIGPSNNPTFFPSSSADITVRGKVIGSFGVLHPEVNVAFKLDLPCSALEIDIHPFV